MKKKLLLFGVILILSVFEIQVRPRYTQANELLQSNRSNVQTWTERYDGMIYRIWISPSALQVVNVTKDQLEVEKLKLEIKKLKTR